MKALVRMTVYVLLLFGDSAMSPAQEPVNATPNTSQTQDAQSIRVTRSGFSPPTKGSADYFTGNVRIESPFEATEPARVSGATVTFEAGARTAWHRHPLGQTLIVMSGIGRVQREGGPVEEIRSGDIVWIPPHVKHWHGAAPDSSMSHIAIAERLEGKVVDWMEKVTDEQYAVKPTTQQKTDPTAIQNRQPNRQGRRPPPADVQRVAPALERDTQERLYGEVWNRSGLSKRDRSLVTISALIARGQMEALADYFDQAIEHGVKPSEISETITHLAYYSGWANAFGAIGPAKEVFARRGVTQDQLPPAAVELLPIDEQVEAQRKNQVDANFGTVAPGIVEYTTDALFRDLWLRPGLSPRDRSLVTVSALIANGQSQQVAYHLNRAMDNGLTQEQASETFTQLAFYAGWPNVFSALPVAKDVFEKRVK